MLVTKYSDLRYLCITDLILSVPIKGEDLCTQMECIWNCYQALLDIYGISIKQEFIIKPCFGPGNFDFDSSFENAHFKTFQNIYPHSRVALGGTFDRLHYGHKVLLTFGALIASEELIVGVTSKGMASKKIMSNRLEPVEKRMNSVREFLCAIDYKSYRIVELTDPCGPTIIEPDISALVVTEETKQGAHYVNQKRYELGMESLTVYTVPLLCLYNRTNDDSETASKLSSTDMRLLDD